MAFFPCKEEVIWLEKNVINRQHRIYPDACDVGVYEHEIDIDTARTCVKALIDFYGREGGRNGDYKYKSWKSPATGQKQISFVIPVEEDEGYVFGATVDILGVKPIRRSEKPWICVEIRFGQRLFPSNR